MGCFCNALIADLASFTRCWFLWGFSPLPCLALTYTHRAKTTVAVKPPQPRRALTYGEVGDGEVSPESPYTPRSPPILGA